MRRGVAAGDRGFDPFSLGECCCLLTQGVYKCPEVADVVLSTAFASIVELNMLSKLHVYAVL
jgi:hypothetical protein